MLFSWRAEQAAEDASSSAKKMRETLQSIDVMTELSRLDGRIDDLVLRLDTGSWEIVSERASDLRVSLASIIALSDLPFDEELVDKLLIAVTQFKNISNGAKRADGTEKNSPDASRFHRIVIDHKESIALAIVALKTQMGDTYD